MTSRAHWKFLIAALITSGCQSTGSMLPWSASKDPVYSSSELAALDSPRPLAAGVESSVASVKTVNASSNIQQVAATMPGPAVAGNVDELVRRGQATIREAGQDNPAKLQQARDILNQALAIDGSNTSAHHSMAIVADLQKDFQAAEFHYKQALQSRPQDASLLNDMGYSYLLQNRFHEATQYLNQTLQYEPQHERAHVNLALLSLKRGDRAAAQNRLSGIYSAADVQTTLARLEQDLQSTDGTTAMAVAAANAPMNTMTNQNLPQFNPQGQYPPRQQFQARNANQNQFDNSGQVGQDSPPVHVYPPGVSLSDEETNVAGASAFPSDSGVSSYTNQIDGRQTMQNQPTQNQQFGAMPGLTVSHYNPNGTSLQQNQYGTVQYANPQPQHGLPMYPASQSQFSAQSAQQGLLQQMDPQQQHQMAVGSASYPSGINAPLAGLNAGPGSLFPIEAEPTAVQSYNTPMPQPNQNQQYPMGQNGYPVMNTPAIQYGAAYPAANHMPQNQQPMYPNPAAQPQQSYQNNTYPASSTQYPPQINGYNSQGQQQYGPPQATPYLGAANGRQPMPLNQAQTPSPLAAYEQQLQNLDNRYNQAVQQMDGNGMPLGPAPVQYR